MTLKQHNFTVDVDGVSMPVDYDIVATLICDGIQYLGWIKVEQVESPKKLDWKQLPDKKQLSDADYPLNDGSLIVRAQHDPELFRFDLHCIEEGLTKLFAEQPGYAADILEDNTDNETASLFWEYCLYGGPISE